MGVLEVIKCNKKININIFFHLEVILPNALFYYKFTNELWKNGFGKYQFLVNINFQGRKAYILPILKQFSYLKLDVACIWEIIKDVETFCEGAKTDYGQLRERHVFYAKMGDSLHIFKTHIRVVCLQLYTVRGLQQSRRDLKTPDD